MTRTGNLVDKILDASASPDGPLDQERQQALWVAATTILGGILLRTDDVSRLRLLRGLDTDVRQAAAGIAAIMTHGPNAAPKGH